MVILMLILVGCTSSGTREARRRAQDKEKALAALVGYMEGRKRNDLPGAYQYLSPESRKLYTQDEFVAYYKAFPVMQWTLKGDVNLISVDWARVVVYDIAVTRDGATQTLADHPYYVQNVKGSWGVAVVNPVMDRMRKLPVDQQPGFARVILKADPYNKTIHKSIFASTLAEGNIEEADKVLKKLYSFSSPSDLPELQLLKADIMLTAEQPIGALTALEKALELGPSYPEMYDAPWRSTTLTEVGRAQGMLGRLPESIKSLEEAMTLNPENAEATMLLENIRKLQS
jgi:tetratricopeptide (TPR) repeat protein